MTTRHIVPMITDRIKDHLINQMQTLVDVDDPIRANEVKVGRFQDNPMKFTVYVAVQGGDPENPNYRDGIVSLKDFDDVSYSVPARGVFDGEAWWRRGIIQFGCYFKGETEDDSRELSYQVLGRISEGLVTLKVSDLTDHYGEQAIRIFPYASSIFESGGPKANYVWRGKVYWTCLTGRS